ncbi:MAG: site-specific DNA-methyltransferase, partial [Desulfuromonadales bacterium]|nr:site-specific DNA-methyltransferase [Desulfuromonadales bacterium]
VKILMDEVFGDACFLNNIVWCYQTRQFSKKYWNRKHHDIFLYGMNEDNYVFNWDDKGVLAEYSEETIKKYKLQDDIGFYRLCGRGIEGSPIKGAKDVDQEWENTHPELVVRDYLRAGFAPSDWWEIDIVNQASNERTDYNTQKPEALLERITLASSNKNMVVADFFGGSGVTATVANRLGRRFIHVDIGINSIQTTRDRLVVAKADFDILEIKDGVSLFRNPVQTMDKLKSLITGLRNEDALDSFWEGAIADSKLGMVPVYVPNLLDHTTRVLDIPLMNRILNEAMPDLPDETKQIIVYYIDIDDEAALKAFIADNNPTETAVVLRDLKELLHEVVADDVAEYELSQTKKDWIISFASFTSDRLVQKIDEYNQKRALNGAKNNLLDDEAEDTDPLPEVEEVVQKPKKKFKPIVISENGLELIELVSLDCTNAEGIWTSDHEIKIDKNGYVINNGVKTKTFWDATITCPSKPLRMKIRNIAGDETVFKIIRVQTDGSSHQTQI